MSVSKYFNSILIICLCFGFQTAFGSEEQSEPITIVSSWKNAPFSFELPDGRPAGLYIDFWKMWSEINDIPIKIVLSSLEDSVTKLKGKNKIHAGLFKNSQRLKWADFSIPMHHVKTGILFGAQYSKSARLQDIENRQVAVQSNTYQAGYLKENFPNIEIVYFDQIDLSIDLLLSGKVHAIVGEIPTLKSMIARRGFSGTVAVAEQIIVSNEVHGVISKGQPELLRKINEGIKNIPIERLIENEKKWLPGLEVFFKGPTTLGSLTLAEKDWLAENNNFSLGVETTWYPFEFVDEDGEFKGIAAEYVEDVQNTLGINLTPVDGYSWSDALERLKIGEIDVMSGVVNNASRAKLMNFTDPYFAIPGVIVVRHDSSYVESLADLKNKKAGIVRGYILVDSVGVDYPEIDIVEVASVADGLLRVQDGELDAYIGAIAVVNYEISKRNLNGLMVAASTPYSFEISMAVRKGLEPLVTILNKSFASMDEAQKSAIANKWLAVSMQIGLDLKTILFWAVPIVSFLLIIIFVFARINRRLNTEISNREQSQKEQRMLEARLNQSQKLEALGKLTGGIAHDFNNMLGIINGYSEILTLETDKDSSHHEYAEEILRAGNRGAKLTSKLLAYSRKQVLESISVNINELLMQQQDMLQKTLTVEVSLVMDLQEDLWQCWIDASEFEDAVINLCINAMHALKGNQALPQLLIKTSNTNVSEDEAELFGIDAGKYVVLAVVDNGCGMDKQTLTRIFDPFFTTKGRGGSGLGLSQTYGFMQRSKGLVLADSKPGAGAEFLLYFPKYDLADTGQALKEKVDEYIGNENILIVDDEPALRNLASELLSRKGYKTFKAVNGQDALNLLEKQEIDLIFSDVIMPGMGGYELAAIVEEKFPKIKIQLASGFVDEDRKMQKNGELEMSVISKPYTSQTLYEAVRNLLDS